MIQQQHTLSDTALALGVTILKKTMKSVVDIGRAMYQLGADNTTEYGYWILNTETDECYYSPKFSQSLGYDEEEISYNRISLQQLVADKKEFSIYRSAKLLLTGIVNTVENTVTYLRKDGKQVTYDCSITTVDDQVMVSILFGSHNKKKYDS